MRALSLLLVVLVLLLMSSCFPAHVQPKPAAPGPSAASAVREAYYLDHKPVAGGAYMQLSNGERITVMEELLATVDARSETARSATAAANARIWGSVGANVGVVSAILFVPTGGWLITDSFIYPVNCVGGGLCDLLNEGPPVVFVASSIGLLGGVAGAIVANVVAHAYDASAFETYDSDLKEHLGLDKADAGATANSSAVNAP